MKRASKAAGAALALLVVAFLLGPRPRVDTRLEHPSLPKDLAAHVKAGEARFADLRPDCGKRIAWVSPDRAKTPLSVVYLHGFSATRQETAPLTERLAAALGANRYEARLTGHGRSEAAMGDATVGDWLRDGEEALAIGRRLGDRVVVVACSTGATLATWLAANGHAEGLLALVLVSPNYGTRSSMAQVLTWPWGEQIVRLAVGETRSFTPINDAQAAYWTTSYPSRALVPMQALVDLANDSDLSRITAPTLVVYSPKDTVVDPTVTEARFPRFGSPVKRLLRFEGSEDPAQHVLAGDALAPGSTARLLEHILAFLAPLRG